MMKREGGATLIELLTTVVISAILLAIAVPSFTDLINKRRVDGVANLLSSDLQLLRSLSIDTKTALNAQISSSGYTLGATLKSVTIDSRCSLSAVSPSTFPVTVTFNENLGVTNSSFHIRVGCTGTSYSLNVEMNEVGQVRVRE